MAKNKVKKEGGKKAAAKDGTKKAESSPGNRWVVVAGALLVQLCLGSIYAYSTFAKPIGAQVTVTPITLQLPFVVGLASLAGIMVFAGKWQDKAGPRVVALTGGILFGVGILASGLATDIYQLTITYGLIGGSGIGMGYVCPIAALVKWFPDKKGLISGVAVASFGAGSFIIAQIATVVMSSGMPAIDSTFLKKEAVDLNHEDGVAINTSATFEDLDATQKATLVNHIETKNITAADKTFYKSVRTAVYAHFDLTKTFYVLGVFYMVLVSLGAMLLRNPPAGYKPPGWNPPQPKPGAAPVKVDFSPTEMVKTHQYWLLWVTYILGTISGLMIIGNVGLFAAANSITAAQIAWIVGVLALFNGAGRIVWGAMGDKVGRPRTLMMMYLISGIVMAIMYPAVTNYDDPDQRFMMLTLCVSAIGFCFGGNFAMYPSTTADYFGTKSYGLNYGLVFTAYGVSGAAGGILAGYLTDPDNPITHGNPEAWQTVFQVMAVLCFIAMALTFTLKSPQATAADKRISDEKKKQKDEEVDEEE